MNTLNTAGQPHTCSVGGCSNVDIEQILSNSDLDSGARSREVEASSGGLIQIIKPGEKGLVPYHFAKLPPVASDTGACE